MIVGEHNARIPANRNAVKATAKLFLWAFFLACLIFWWLPSLLYRFVLGIADPVQDAIILISFFAWFSFFFGFWLNRPQFPKYSKLSIYRLDALEWFSRGATLALTVPSVLLAINFFLYRSGVDYGGGQGLSGTYQAILYAHLFFGFLYLGVVGENRKLTTILLIVVILIIPRLIISLNWGRFFLAQAIIPIVFIFMSRGWLKLKFRQVVFFVVLLCFIIFVPAIARGDSVFGPQEIYRFFASGSTLKLFQDNLNLNLTQRCSPLFVSLTAKIIPYGQLHVCTIDIWGVRSLPATLDRLLAFQEIGYSDLLVGPGSNYLLELHLTGGFGAIVLGSILFGFSCKWFVYSLAMRSAFVGIWAECLTRALFAPRSNIGYVFERIPSLLAATVIVMFVATTLYRKRKPKLQFNLSRSS